MKALITGGAGALGSSLSKLLVSKGWDVDIYDIIRIDEAWRLYDIIDEVNYCWKSIHDMTKDDFDNINLVAHCAAQPDRPLGLSSPYTTMWLNIMGLIHVLEACRNIKLEKFLFPSSGTMFTGNLESELPVTEDTVPRPTNPYSASKYMSEVLVDTYRRCYNIPTVLLRSGLVYGDGMRLDISIAQFIKKSLLDKTFKVYSPGASRTPTHVDDVMLYWDAIIKAEPEKVVGKIFHSVYGKEYSVIDMAKIVTKVVGTGEAIPDDILYEDGEFINGKPVRDWSISTKDEYLDVQPCVDLEEGIRRTISYISKWMRDDVG